MAGKFEPDFNWEGMIAKFGPDFNWEGMMKWWSAHSDGSHRPVSEDDQQDLLPCIGDVIDRVLEISAFFRVYDPKDFIGEPITAKDLEAPLDELRDLVQYVDVTKELHSVGGLARLFNNVLYYENGDGLYSKDACIRAKAAEAITIMLQNNPRSSQQLVMEVNGLQLLLYNLTSDPDLTARTKALGAISSLIRNNKLGKTSFRQNKGYKALRNASGLMNSVEFQTEALNLIQYLLHENSPDCNIVIHLGFPHIMMHLTSSDDAQVREAALRGLLVLATYAGGNSGRLVKNGLQPLLYNLTSDPDETARTKALGAISSLIRNNKLGKTSFRQKKGYRALRDALRSVSLVEFQMEALNLIQYLLHENSPDCNIVIHLGFPHFMMHLISSDDAHVREAALRGLLVLATYAGGNSGRLLKNDYKLKQVLQERRERICAMAPEDLGAASEERQLVDSLWNACLL